MPRRSFAKSFSEDFDPAFGSGRFEARGSILRKKGQGLGDYFLDSLYSDIDSLQLYAGIHPIHFKRFYRLLSERFPYAVYYEVREQTAYVRAVLDLRRDPDWIERKLRRLE